MNTAHRVLMPDERQLQQCPEVAILEVLDSALHAVDLSLRAEHPTVDTDPFDPECEVVPTLLTANLILFRTEELRGLIQLYRVAVHRAICSQDEDDREGPYDVAL